MEAKGGTQTTDCMHESRIRLFMKAAKRVLMQVKDFYVGPLSDCSSQLDYSAVLSCPASQMPITLPRSFCARSTKLSSRRENQISRAASTKSFAGERQRLRKHPTAAGVLPRSYSVGMRKIDEEKTFEFEEEEEEEAVVAGVYSRGRSQAVRRRRQLFLEDYFIRFDDNEVSVDSL